MLALRRTLAVICFLIYCCCDAFSGLLIYGSVNGEITYYYGLLLFVPIFILSYWFSTFFSQLTCGKQSGKRIMPRWLRSFIMFISNLVSLALLGFWGYIYINQAMYTPENELAFMNIRAFMLP